jgi:hypothetical protein
MKTLSKIAKAKLMEKEGYELGDFTLKFTGFESISNHSTKVKNTVIARFEVFSLEGEYSIKPEMVYNYELFSYGFVTPKGYKSSKQVPVVVSNPENLTVAEVKALLVYKSDYKINTYDPFYAENEANRRNASAWNYVAKNFITDPYCTR